MSTTSEVPPYGRSSSDQPPPPEPNVLFDAHLRLLSESYLNFFLERKRVEEIYIDNLLRLHHKFRSIDFNFDERAEIKPSLRSVWNEVRDDVEREAGARGAFLNTLNTDVINPIITFKETQDRIRKRIREDLKSAVEAHNEYITDTYPKLKRSYLKKSAEVEEMKATNASAPAQSPTVSTDHHHHHSHSSSKQILQPPYRPIVTAPQPLRPLDRRPSGSVPATRQRSPSSSTALQDLAHQGKKQFNQIVMGFLDKGNGKDTRSDIALRTVRAKREAEEADKEYRKAVHWLETLRLRRTKILESGYKSWETLLRESSETMKVVLIKYTDNLIATTVSQTQLHSRARKLIDTINPEKDASSVALKIPVLLANATPQPSFYYNYTVGECRDLIFGVSLVDYATSRGLQDGDVPKIVKLCIKEIEARGMEAEGIYRVSGRHAAVQELQHKIERNEAAFQFNPTYDDVYAISSLLKLYLRELPEPVFKFPLQERIQHTGELEEHIANNFQLLRSKIRRLPPVHQATLKAIVEHLARVASQSEKNKMDPRNLAIVFGSVIFGEDEMPKGGDLLSVQSWKDTLMEDLINNAFILFQTTNSPPLPPAPLNEQPASITYGSSHTKVNSMPPSGPVRRNAINIGSMGPPHDTQSPHFDGPRSADDFTPQLPPRPANSIHPSLRAGPLPSPPIRNSLPPPPRQGLVFDDDTAPNLSNIITPTASRSSNLLTTTTASSTQASLPHDPPPASPTKSFFVRSGRREGSGSSARTDSPGPSPSQSQSPQYAFPSLKPPPLPLQDAASVTPPGLALTSPWSDRFSPDPHLQYLRSQTPLDSQSLMSTSSPDPSIMAMTRDGSEDGQSSLFSTSVSAPTGENSPEMKIAQPPHLFDSDIDHPSSADTSFESAASGLAYPTSAYEATGPTQHGSGVVTIANPSLRTVSVEGDIPSIPSPASPAFSIPPSPSAIHSSMSLEKVTLPPPPPSKDEIRGSQNQP
ncbi:hypothetical protein C8Q75DRAFT_848735 [Abortiporus biennis]|nr:hypothetical protein C8Q75DRAFT_848735 [Abortiporus biennis]